MADDRQSAVWWRAAFVGLGLSTVLFAVLAARADSRPLDASAWTTVLDVAVGLAFVGAALWAPAPVLERVLIAAAESPIGRLTPREQEILALMAEGRSNAGIAQRLNISERTVEAASAQVFQKLDLEPSHDLNRRVLAVLTLLNN